MRIILPSALLLLLQGCAGEIELRQVAGQSNAILSTYRTAVRDFAVGQTALNAANESRLLQLKRMREMREAEIEARVASWRLGGDDKALKRFAVLGDASADQVLASAESPAAPATAPALAYDGAPLDAILKQLVELQKPISAQQRLEDLVAYGSDLSDAYKAAIEAAKTDAAGAEAEANAKTKEEETKENTVK